MDLILINLFYRFSDYCYLIDENPGCYDTRRNRMCIVINANTEKTAFSNGKTDSEMIKNTMNDLDFSVKIFQKEKNETHTILINKLKKGKLPNEYAFKRVVQCSIFCFYFIFNNRPNWAQPALLPEIVVLHHNINFKETL